MIKNLNRSALLFLLLLAGCAPFLTGRQGNTGYLNQSTDRYLHSIYLKGASWSVMAVDLETGRILMSHDAERELIPGSNMKLLTTACALETLGPDFRAATVVGYTGRIDPPGSLDGDLLVIGSGDPTISTRFRENRISSQMDTTDTFDAWADSLAAKGIRQIRGGIVGYNGLFGGGSLGSGWEWDDLPNWYAAEFGPLVYADDCIEIAVLPGDSSGQPAAIRWAPELGFITVRNAVTTSDSGTAPNLGFARELGNNIISIYGTIPLYAQPQRRWVAIHDPAGFFLNALEASLKRHGIEILGSLRISSSWQVDDANFKVLFADASPPLSSLLRTINQLSQNQHAELLVRLLGVTNSKGETMRNSEEEAFSAGRNRIREWEAKLVGTATGFVMVDGSGLSRRNLASANEFIKVLVHMNRSQYKADFLNSLAQPGIGTLENRFQGLPRDITLQAKTGSLSRTRALSGYLSQSGQPKIVFSFLCNNYLCASDEVDQTMENLVQLLALYLKEK